VVSVLPGGVDVGVQLCEDERVDGVSFTGSTAVGAEIMRRGASGIKRLMLELGGKNANIIFADADLERAAVMAAGSAFGNAGQSCSARSRILVQRSAEGAFVEALTRAAASLVPGEPFDTSTTFSPLISEQHRDTVAGKVKAAIESGSSLALGGSAPNGKGFFYNPTILTDVSPHNPAFTSEIFGPVCSITVFDDEQEAVRLANSSEYGLNGSVWSRDIGRALRTTRALRTGMVSVNGLASASRNSLYAPFGGYKRSGIGRELGMNALQFYTEIKTVSVDHGDLPI
jgi:betaine-aldehyde dehydrogenase